MYRDHSKVNHLYPLDSLLWQQYYKRMKKSDAGATLDVMFDIRWCMVLDSLNNEEAPFSQGTLCDFRHRLIKYNMDEILLSNTVR